MFTHDPEQLMFGYVAGRYGPPAFVRRQRQVDEAWEAQVAKCRADRDRMLHGVRVAAVLAAQALDVSIGGEDVEEDVAVLTRETALVGTRRARNAIRQVADAVGRFNRAWAEYLAGVSLDEINRLRDGYNRYYVLEKECALKSERLARLGFRPLPPATMNELASEVAGID